MNSYPIFNLFVCLYAYKPFAFFLYRIYIQKISIRVKGTEANLNALKVEDIKAVIDLTGKTAGEYTLPVTITLPEGYEQVEEVQATVQLNQAEKTSE